MRQPRQSNPHDIEFRAAIEQLRPGGIALSESRFVASTPERRSDVGHIAELYVREVVLCGDGSLVHNVDDTEALHRMRLGTVVFGVVDWGHRFAMMRLHTAVHLSFHAYIATHGPARRCRRRVSATMASIEIEPGDGHQLAEAEVIREWVGRAIADDLTISTIGGPGDDDRRYWHIDGIGTIACTGMHPPTTAAVGPLDLEVLGNDGEVITIEARLAAGGAGEVGKVGYGAVW
jgi:Ser-tRNA(Ala) deacylase AlaX